MLAETSGAGAHGASEGPRLPPEQDHPYRLAGLTFEVPRATKMVAFGHPNHHTRQPVGDGGTEQCLWHSAVGAPAARGSRGLRLRNRPQKGTVRASVAAPALVWAPSITTLLILAIRAASDSVSGQELVGVKTPLD